MVVISNILTVFDNTGRITERAWCGKKVCVARLPQYSLDGLYQKRIMLSRICFQCITNKYIVRKCMYTVHKVQITYILHSSIMSTRGIVIQYIR
jgi:hypothetical protein